MATTKAAKKTKTPPKFNPEILHAHVESYTTGLIRKKALPYLQHLLDESQKKTKYPISLCQGMGTCFIDLGADWSCGGWSVVEDAYSDCNTPDETSTTSRCCGCGRSFPS